MSSPEPASAKKPAAAAKSQPAASGTKRTHSDESKSINDTQTFFKRIADGKKKSATPEQIQDAQVGFDLLTSGGLTREQKFEFAQKLQTTKSTKNYQWVREFHASIQVTKEEKEGVLENYYTRTSAYMLASVSLCVKVVLRHTRLSWATVFEIWAGAY
tara:strand:- start:227 stop:700 length:474 start_codon:yes stop_codon:yes gene_type:complete